jgi:DNA-binding CsgD family transcriptional regulator/uncharacterized FlaG/YvyC family protein
LKRNNSDGCEKSTAGPAGSRGQGVHPIRTLSFADVLTKDLTATGSFDVRGNIWASTFGKLLQALPISAALVDSSYQVVAANQAWGRICPAEEAELNIQFSRLFASPADASEIRSITEEVFNTRRACAVEALIGAEKAGKMWGRITFRPIRIVQDRFLLILVEDLTAEKKLLAINRKRREKLESSRSDLEKKVTERTAQLSLKNQRLRQEINQRRKTEQALKTIVAKIDEQLKELREDVALKMRIFLQPLIDHLKAEVSSEACLLIIRAMEHHLANTFSSLGVRTASKIMILTPREMQVCNLIASGLTSKQIASIMHVTPGAINSQRLRIRKKLELDLSHESMATWLSRFWDSATAQS